MEQRSHQTGTPLSQNGTSLLLPLNETAYPSLAYGLFGLGRFLQQIPDSYKRVIFMSICGSIRLSLDTLSLNGTTVSQSGTTVSQNGTSLSLERSGSTLFFHGASGRLSPAIRGNQNQFMYAQKACRQWGLQAFFSIWRDSVERFKSPKRSVERPCSRHLS